MVKYQGHEIPTDEHNLEVACMATYCVSRLSHTSSCFITV